MSRPTPPTLPEKLLADKKHIVDLLTMKSSSLPKARKVNGGSKKPRVPNPETGGGMNMSRFTNPVHDEPDIDRQQEIEAEKADHENDVARETDPDTEFRGWPPMPNIKPLPQIMSAEELKERLK